VTCLLKARIVEREEMAAATEWLGKHASVATDMHAAIDKLLEVTFSMYSVPRPYTVDEPNSLF
jgi:hypothetical protein